MLLTFFLAAIEHKFYDILRGRCLTHLAFPPETSFHV